MLARTSESSPGGRLLCHSCLHPNERVSRERSSAIQARGARPKASGYLSWIRSSIPAFNRTGLQRRSQQRCVSPDHLRHRVRHAGTRAEVHVWRGQGRSGPGRLPGIGRPRAARAKSSSRQGSRRGTFSAQRRLCESAPVNNQLHKERIPMQMGMIGLGRMGANMVRRLLRGGHQCVVFDTHKEAIDELVKEGATGAASLDDFAKKLTKPRVAWIMVPAAVVESTLADLTKRFEGGDIIVDGGNSYYIDDIRRANSLKKMGIHYVDSGTSGGVYGLERGYCQMIGGETEVVKRLDPIFARLAPSIDEAPRTPGREKVKDSTAENGYLHCGPNGAGHFVKMVHNGIEYGIMAAYAEGLNILRHANVGKHTSEVDAETTPLREPEHYQYDFNLPDISEVWRRGSV